MPANLTAKLKSFDSTLPLDKARTIPSAWYFDPEIYGRVQDRLRRYLADGLPDAIKWPKPGAFVTAEIAGEPILVVATKRDAARLLERLPASRRPGHRPEKAPPRSCAAAITAGPTTSPAGSAASRSSTASRTFDARTTASSPLARRSLGAVRVRPRWATSRTPLAELLAPLPERCSAAGSRTAALRRAPRVRRWRATGRSSSITTWTAATTSTRSIPAWRRARLRPLPHASSRQHSVQISPLQSPSSDGCIDRRGPHRRRCVLLVGLPQPHAQRLRRRHGHEPGPAAGSRSLPGHLRLLLRRSEGADGA